KFSGEDWQLLRERLAPNDNVHFNGYGENNTYTTEFIMRGDKIVEKEANKYQLFWGDTEIPVEYYNGTSNEQSTYKTQVKDLLKIVRQPLSFKKEGRPFKPEKVLVTFYGKDTWVAWVNNLDKNGFPQSLKEFKDPIVSGHRSEDYSDNQTTFTYQKPTIAPVKLSLKGQQKIYINEADYQKIFDLIDGEVKVNIQTLDEYLISTTIVASSPSSVYRPPHKLVYKDRDVFNFQLITPLEGPAILKIDTVKSAKTARLFRNKSKYQIIHIPNFQTIERTLDEKKQKVGHQHIRPILYNSVTKTDLLPNYIVDNPANLTLFWGDLTANPESENSSIKTFFQETTKAPKLLYEGQDFPFSKIRMTIINDETVYTKSFRADDFSTPEMAKILGKVDNKTSIYFDKIEVEDQGVTKHLQHRFLFKVGNAVLKAGLKKVDVSKTKIPKKPNSPIQIKWGDYTFNCKEQMVNNSKVCSCEGKYLRKADLKKINKKGFEFLVNGEAQDFKEVSVYTNGHVYCKKENLMISSDQQRIYN
ncbi:MAG: hypothetical protein AAGJ18_30830, partial [Bacteroidota bacterium]